MALLQLKTLLEEKTVIVELGESQSKVTVLCFVSIFNVHMGWQNNQSKNNLEYFLTKNSIKL
jgi:hypothetical protein